MRVEKPTLFSYTLKKSWPFIFFALLFVFVLMIGFVRVGPNIFLPPKIEVVEVSEVQIGQLNSGVALHVPELFLDQAKARAKDEEDGYFVVQGRVIDASGVEKAIVFEVHSTQGPLYYTLRKTCGSPERHENETFELSGSASAYLRVRNGGNFEYVLDGDKSVSEYLEDEKHDFNLISGSMVATGIFFIVVCLWQINRCRKRYKAEYPTEEEDVFEVQC